MSGDYLWDRSAPVDIEVRRLEQLLGTLRHRERPPAPRRWAPAAVAAAVLIGIGVAQLRLAVPAGETPWLARGATERLHVGARLLTERDLTIEADEIGRVDVAAGSELRVLGSQTLGLDRGAIHALIWAPPRQFVVHTPSARTVDLGCEYTLSVDRAGNGLVRVQTGWVAFQFAGRESFIPAGAACRTTRAGGPGVPYFEDAGEEFRRAVESGDLKAVLALARPRDGLTLWHLLARVREQDRGAVFDRLASLVALPAEATREGAIALDAGTLDRCWNALNLESADWWREWKRNWSGALYSGRKSTAP